MTSKEERDKEIEELIRGFDLHLQTFQCVGKNSRTNYLSWIRFLMNDHANDLIKLESEEDVQKIIKLQKALQMLPTRTKYRTQRDLGNFRSTLRRFMKFMYVWRIRQKELAQSKDFDKMIEMIENAPTREMANSAYESIIMHSLMIYYHFNQMQADRILKALAKHDCKINADKLFMPGSNCYAQQKSV